MNFGIGSSTFRYIVLCVLGAVLVNGVDCKEGDTYLSEIVNVMERIRIDVYVLGLILPKIQNPGLKELISKLGEVVDAECKNLESKTVHTEGLRKIVDSVKLMEPMDLPDDTNEMVAQVYRNTRISLAREARGLMELV